ncbi:hypothetical protein ROBYS_41500 [Roseobacter sp. OBYS 0001]|nr:hypothetical protein ROBYS_41500 [Roseobacter sp. OBYS 0001]
MQVQLAAIGPEMPREDALWHKRHMVLEPGARAGEQIIKDMAHGQDGGPGINRSCRTVHGSDFPAGVVVPLKQSDLHAAGRKAQRGGKTCDARTNHDGAWPVGNKGGC